MNADADAAHIMAEIRTFRRQMDELAALTEGSAKQDLATANAGCSPEYGEQLEARENVLQAAREVVEGTTSEMVEGTATFRQVTFRDLPNVRIRLEANPQGRTQEALLEKRGEKGWSSGPMDPQDAEDLEWLLRAIGE